MTIWDGIIGFGFVMGFFYIIVSKIVSKHPSGKIAEFMNSLKSEQKNPKNKLEVNQEYTQQLYPERRSSI